MAKIIGKMSFNKKDTETITVLGEPLKEKLKAPVDPTESKWIKNTQRQVAQLHTALKRHGLNSNFADLDLDLKKEESLPSKYKFPNMKKYSGTDVSHLHLK